MRKNVIVTICHHHKLLLREHFSLHIALQPPKLPEHIAGKSGGGGTVDEIVEEAFFILNYIKIIVILRQHELPL